MKNLSDLPVAQLWQAGILRGVYPDGSEWAKNDNSCEIASSFYSECNPRKDACLILWKVEYRGISDFCQDLLQRPQNFPLTTQNIVVTFSNIAYI